MNIHVESCDQISYTDGSVTLDYRIDDVWDQVTVHFANDELVLDFIAHLAASRRDMLIRDRERQEDWFEKARDVLGLR